MMRPPMLGLLLALPLLGCVAADRAATHVQAAAQASTNPTLSTRDAAFFDQAARAGIEAVTFGQLARTQTASTAIRAFAVRVIADSTTINQKLTRLAATKRINPPLQMDLAHQQAYAALAKLHGRDFDLAYLNSQATDRKAMLALFEDEARNGADRQVRAFAQRTVPAIRTLLRDAERLGGRPAPAAS